MLTVTLTFESVNGGSASPFSARALRSANFVGDAAEQELVERLVGGNLRRHDAVDAIRRLLMSGVGASPRHGRPPAAAPRPPARPRPRPPAALRLRHGGLRVGHGLVGLRERRLRFRQRLVGRCRRRRRRHETQDAGGAERLHHVVPRLPRPAAAAGRRWAESRACPAARRRACP